MSSTAIRCWTGNPPRTCDVCAELIEYEFVDGKTLAGPWAMMCLPCHRAHGVGIGEEMGQHYRAYVAPEGNKAVWLNIDA